MRENSPRYQRVSPIFPRAVHKGFPGLFTGKFRGIPEGIRAPHPRTSMRPSSLAPLLLLGLLCTACTSPEKRIKQNKDAFLQYPPDVRENIRNGEIEIGYSREMVRMAKGDPHYVQIRETQEAEVEVWRWTRPERHLHTQPAHFYGRAAPNPQVVEVAAVREVEVLRVEFLDDKAIVVENLKEN